MISSFGRPPVSPNLRNGKEYASPVAESFWQSRGVWFLAMGVTHLQIHLEAPLRSDSGAEL